MSVKKHPIGKSLQFCSLFRQAARGLKRPRFFWLSPSAELGSPPDRGRFCGNAGRHRKAGRARSDGRNHVPPVNPLLFGRGTKDEGTRNRSLSFVHFAGRKGRPPSPPKTPRAARQTAPAAPHPRPLSPKNHQTPAHDPHSCPLTRIYVCSVVYTTYCNILFPVLSR